MISEIVSVILYNSLPVTVEEKLGLGSVRVLVIEMFSMFKHVQISHMLVRPVICGQQGEFKLLINITTHDSYFCYWQKSVLTGKHMRMILIRTSRCACFSCSVIVSAHESSSGQLPVQKSGKLSSLCGIHNSVQTTVFSSVVSQTPALHCAVCDSISGKEHYCEIRVKYKVCKRYESSSAP